MGSFLSMLLSFMRPNSVPQLASSPQSVDAIYEQRAIVEDDVISDGYDTDDDTAAECSTSPDDNPLYEAGAVLGLVLDFVGPGMLLNKYFDLLYSRRAANSRSHLSIPVKSILAMLSKRVLKMQRASMCESRTLS
jgi:hypothetical protein